MFAELGSLRGVMSDEDRLPFAPVLTLAQELPR